LFINLLILGLIRSVGTASDTVANDEEHPISGSLRKKNVKLGYPQKSSKFNKLGFFMIFHDLRILL